jgi:O-antigen/teichoic acid export membrane protein
MKVYRELAGQTVIYGLGTIIPRILNFLLTPLYTYTLPANQFGIITEMYSYVAFFMVLLTFGMETTFFRFISQKNSSKTVFNSAFGTLLLFSLIFISSIYIFKDNIAATIGYKDYSNLIMYLALILFFDVLTAIPLAKLRVENRAKFFTIIRVLNVFINISLNIFFFVICKDSDNSFFSRLYNENIGVGYAFISNLIASFFTFIILLPIIIKFRISFSKEILLKMFKYATPLVIVGIAGMVNEVADKLFLKYLTPEHLNPLKQVGIYGANYKLAVLMTIFIQMFKYAAEPFFFKHSNNIDAKDIYSKVMTWFVIFCLLIFLLVSLNIDIFKFMIGADYRTGLYIVPIILLANLFLGIYYNLSVWYKINNLTHFGALISLIGVFITVTLNFLLIPIIGYMGSAIATLSCYFSMVVFSYFIGQKYYKINYQIKRILGYGFLTTIIYFTYNFLQTKMFIINITLSISLMIIFLIAVIKIENIKIKNIKSFIQKT